MKKTDKNSALYAVMNSWTEKTNPLESEFVITVKDVNKLQETIHEYVITNDGGVCAFLTDWMKFLGQKSHKLLADISIEISQI